MNNRNGNEKDRIISSNATTPYFTHRLQTLTLFTLDFVANAFDLYISSQTLDTSTVFVRYLSFEIVICIFRRYFHLIKLTVVKNRKCYYWPKINRMNSLYWHELLHHHFRLVIYNFNVNCCCVKRCTISRMHCTCYLTSWVLKQNMDVDFEEFDSGD